MTGTRGHAVYARTRATNVEAWGADTAACLEELALGVAQAFADTSDARDRESVPVVIQSGSLRSQALQVAREVVEMTATLGVVPVAASLVEDEDGTLSGFFEVVRASPARLVEQVPRHVALAGDLFERRREGSGASRAPVSCEVRLSP